MSRSNQTVKIPASGGVERSAQILKKMRKKEPSDELVKIISEIPETESDKPVKKPGIAAKDLEL